MGTWLKMVALCGCGAVSPVFAQSSVTLYGSLDTGITYTSDVASAPRGGVSQGLWQSHVPRNFGL